MLNLVLVVFTSPLNLLSFSVECHDLLNELRLSIVCSHVEIATSRLLLMLVLRNIVHAVRVGRHLNSFFLHEISALSTETHWHLLLSCSVWISLLLFDLLRLVFLLVLASEGFWLRFLLLRSGGHVSGIWVVRGGSWRLCSCLFLLGWDLLGSDYNY